jgi:hypothetical protein
VAETTKEGSCTGSAVAGTLRCSYRERGLDRTFGILAAEVDLGAVQTGNGWFMAKVIGQGAIAE